MGDPWLSIVGIGEDGLAGLGEASREAIARAECVFGGPRHLALAGVEDRGNAWPVPFDATPVLACRGRRTVVLASGDPFWFGVGGTLAPLLDAGEWTAHAAPSTFSLAAARLGWRLEDTICLGLHAAPLERLAPVITRGARIVCLVRDADAASALATWLTDKGWGQSRLWLLTALGGPREKIERSTAETFRAARAEGPLAVAIEAIGSLGLPRVAGLDDSLFQHDGNITKRPMRALALSTLAPRPRERLWDIGAGSGSVSIEWALAGGTSVAIDQRADRASNIRANADVFGVAHRIEVVEGTAPDALPEGETPDAIFIGGGLSGELYEVLRSRVATGTRLVAHAVTLESESLLVELHARYGGDLMRIELAHAEPLGRMRSWRASRPVVQWSAAT